MSLNLAVAAAAWAIASAIGIAAVGAVTLSGGRSRPRGALAFGLFSVAWGLQIVLQNSAGLVSSQVAAERLYLGHLVLLLVTPFFLVAFAAAQGDARRRPRWTVVQAGVVTLAFVVVLLLLVAPGLIYYGVDDFGTARFYPLWGALYGPLVVAPHFVALAVALWGLARARDLAPTPRTARRAVALLAGLGLYAAFAGSNNFAFFLVQAFGAGSDGTTLLYVLLFGALALLALVVGVRALRRARALPRADAMPDLLVAAAILVPLVWGAAEGFLAATVLPSTLETVGLWRLAGVGVIAYGLARWRIYDLPQKAAKAAATAGGATAATAGGAAAYGATTLIAASAAVPVAAGLLVLGALLVPSVRFAHRIFGITTSAPRQDIEQSLYGQRIDAYRAALEASLARGTLEEDQDFLAALRERFGITEAEERVLLHYAKSSVIVTRGRQAWDAFERLRLLGEGGAGRTWLARDRARDRLVVLKEPLERWQADEKAREGILREARLAARVRHPNVVHVEEVVEAEAERGADGRARPSSGKGAPIIVMEYLEGGSLADLLRARGALPWRDAATLTIDVLRGVEAIHAGGIVHRDLKPSNVLLTGDGTPKVADFGIALPATTGKTMVDGSTSIAGTLSYLAPEVRLGVTPGDRRSDVYACAALLHECVHGAPPGRAAPVVTTQEVPPDLAAALARGLSERPEDRPQSARAFAEELARLLR